MATATIFRYLAALKKRVAIGIDSLNLLVNFAFFSLLCHRVIVYYDMRLFLLHLFRLLRHFE